MTLARRSYGTPRQRTRKALRAEAAMFLASARSIDHVTVEWLVARFGLTQATAETMLAAAKGRRNA